jgi:hypothetical protein
VLKVTKKHFARLYVPCETRQCRAADWHPPAHIRLGRSAATHVMHCVPYVSYKMTCCAHLLMAWEPNMLPPAAVMWSGTTWPPWQSVVQCMQPPLRRMYARCSPPPPVQQELHARWRPYGSTALPGCWGNGG